MARPKTDILEREHYTKYFLAVALKKVKTSNDLCRLERTKTLKRTSENYSNFLKSLQKKQFLNVNKNFGKYYEYSVYYDGILLYLSNLANHKYENEDYLNAVYSAFRRAFSAYLSNLKDLSNHSLSNILKAFMSSHHFYLTTRLIEQDMDLDLFTDKTEREEWIKTHPELSLSAVRDLWLLSDLSQAFAYEQGVLPTNKPLMKESLDFWNVFYTDKSVFA